MNHRTCCQNNLIFPWRIPSGTTDLLPFIVFVLSQGFLVGSGVLVEEALEVTGSEFSFCPLFVLFLLLIPFQQFFSSWPAGHSLLPLNHYPSKGRGPFPRPISVLDEAEFTPVVFPPLGKEASSILDTFLSFAPAIAAASPVKGRLSSDMDPEKNPDAGRGGGDEGEGGT